MAVAYSQLVGLYATLTTWYEAKPLSYTPHRLWSIPSYIIQDARPSYAYIGRALHGIILLYLPAVNNMCIMIFFLIHES